MKATAANLTDHPTICVDINSDFFRPPAPTESKNIFPTDVHIPNHVQIWDNNRTWCIIDSVASPARKVNIEWEIVYWSRPVLISGTTGWDQRSLFTGWDPDLHNSSAGVVSSSPDALHMLLQTTCQKSRLANLWRAPLAACIRIKGSDLMSSERIVRKPISPVGIMGTREQKFLCGNRWEGDGLMDK